MDQEKQKLLESKGFLFTKKDDKIIWTCPWAFNIFKNDTLDEAITEAYKFWDKHKNLEPLEF